MDVLETEFQFIDRFNKVCNEINIMDFMKMVLDKHQYLALNNKIESFINSELQKYETVSIIEKMDTVIEDITNSKILHIENKIIDGNTTLSYDTKIKSYNLDIKNGILNTRDDRRSYYYNGELNGLNIVGRGEKRIYNRCIGMGIIGPVPSDLYTGVWSDNTSGIGKITKDGGMYDGEWKNHYPFGKGTFTDGAGNIFKGIWNGTEDYSGEGEVLLPIDGCIFRGGWKNLKIYGDGILIDRDGKIWESNTWLDKYIDGYFYKSSSKDVIEDKKEIQSITQGSKNKKHKKRGKKK